MKKILLLFVLSILFLSQVSALEFDNIKGNYDSVKQEVTLKNSILGIPTTDIAKIRLDTPRYNYVPAGKDIKIHQITIESKQDYLDFITSTHIQLKGKNNNRIFNYKYLTYKTETYNFTAVECNKINCSEIVIGTKSREVEEWVPLNKVDISKGNITIGIFTDTVKGEIFDWIPTIAGVDINEWAIVSVTETIQGGAWGTDGLSNARGWAVNVTYPINVTAFILEGSSTATMGRIRSNDNNVWLFNSSYKSGQTLFFAGAGANLSVGNYRFLADNNASAYDGRRLTGETLPQSTGRITWSLGANEQSTDDGFNILSVVYNVTFNNVANVTLTNPPNISNFSSVTGRTFNATAGMSITSGTSVNATLYLYTSSGTLIGTNFTTNVANNKTNFSMPNLGDGSYKWNILFCGDDSGCVFAPANLTYTIDSTQPVVNIIYPTGAINGLLGGSSLNLNFSVADSTLAFCWRVYNGANTTISCTANSSFTYVSGVNGIQVWANDSTGHIAYAESNWTAGIVINNVNYTNNTFETARENFSISFSSPSILSSTASLVYNGTSYLSTVTCTAGNCTATNSIDLPVISSGTNQNLTFYWMINSYNGTSVLSFNSLTFTQSVNQILLNYCGPPTGSSVVALNFTAYDEQNQTRILPNSIFSFDGNFQYYLGFGTTNKNMSIANSSTTEVDLCINQNQTYYVNSIIAYSAPNSSTTYITRNHFYQHYAINSTMKRIPLYLLRSTSSTSFILQVQDRFVQSVPNVLVNAIRCYPGSNTNETVFISRTDSNGLTTGNLEAETALYQFLITNNSNTLLAVTPCSKVVPQTAPYTLLFQLGTGFVSPFVNIGNVTNLNSSLIFNYTNNILTFTYIDTSNNFSYAKLLVKNLNFSGNTQGTVCDNRNNVSSGIITCNISTAGSYFAQVFVFRNGLNFVDQVTFTVETFSSTVGYYGAFLGFFIILIAAFAFKFNEIAGIWLVNVAVIFCNFVGLIAFGKVFVTALLLLSIVITAVLER